MTAKTCTKCKQPKAPDQFSGKESRCKPCCAELARLKRQQNPEASRAAGRRYRERNLDDERARSRKNTRRWAAAKPERKRAADAAWVKANPEKRRVIARRGAALRAARKRGALFETVDWEAVRQSGTHCHICGCRLPKVRTPQNTQPDHLVALAAGGAHSMRNLSPAHAACNRMRQDEPLPGLLGDWTVRPVSCSATTR